MTPVWLLGVGAAMALCGAAMMDRPRTFGRKGRLVFVVGLGAMFFGWTMVVTQ